MQAQIDLQRRNLAVYARFRAAFVVAGVAVPLALFGLFRRQELRLRALADHGTVAAAVVEQVTAQQGVAHATYRYAVGDDAYTGTASRSEAPYPPGASFSITYLPEDPSLSRPMAFYTRERLQAELDLPFHHRLVAATFAAFMIGALLCHRGVRRLRRSRVI